MADWTQGMMQTYEYWEVNPDTWGDEKLLDTVTDSTITRDSDDETLGNATFEMDAWEGEKYIRTYLVTQQHGLRERWPLGTHLVQADDQTFDGMRGSTSVQGFTPLKVLVDDCPPISYYVDSGYATKHAARLMSTYGKMPVGEAFEAGELAEAYVAEDGDTWMSYCNGLLAKGSAHYALDTRGQVVIAPDQNPASLMPVRQFDDSNSSILRPEVKVTSNRPDIPNVVQVVHSTGSGCIIGEAVNDDPNSETSTVTLGRRKLLRVTSPDLPDNPTQADVDDLAKRTLYKEGATVYEITFTHGYVPDVDLGVAVRLAYSAAGINAVGVVCRQVISCTPGCLVETTAKYTKVVA